jgi:hypothetical protein
MRYELAPGIRLPNTAKLVSVMLRYRLFLIAILLLLPSAAIAQTCAVSQLRVLVRDTRGAPVSGAIVWLGEDANAASRITDEDGAVEFANPRCGFTVVRVTSDGFQELRRDVEITGRAPIEINAALVLQSVVENVDVIAESPIMTQPGSSPAGELQAEDVKFLTYVPSTVSDTLARLPGLLRSADGEINISGMGEHHGAFTVNQADVTDPATGKFGQTPPVDVVEVVNVLKTPFLAQYGNFTSGIVTVATRRGGETWHVELKDPFPEWRIRSTRLAGLRSSTSRVLLGGPIVPGRLYFVSGFQYYLNKNPNRTLPFPFNESKQEFVNSFSQWDYVISPEHLLSGTFNVSPQHINYVNPEYFNPQPVTPSYADHNYRATVSDSLVLGGGTLVSVVSYQRFSAVTGAQGTADMVLSPTGNRGNYFSTQHRNAMRVAWLETWSPARVKRFGNHDFKLGLALNALKNTGQYAARPIDIVDNDGTLLRRVVFSGGGRYSVHDLQVAAFLQDHWTLRSNLNLEIGGRLERQGVASSFRFAPRIGFSWAPFGGTRTVVRGGYGRFYDRVPLDVYAFPKFPVRAVTDFGPNGNVTNAVAFAENVLGGDAGPGSLLVHNAASPGSFAPRNATWKIGVEHTVSRNLLVRTLYENSRTVGLIEMEQLPRVSPVLRLQGSGSSRYRRFEASATINWRNGQQFLVTYSHSSARGTLNDFAGYLGNFPLPMIRPDAYSDLSGDSPHRVLAWGRVAGPWKSYFLPLAEFRTGFPYSRFDALQNYLGIPNRSRFPNYFSLDNRLVKDFLYHSKYTLRFSFSAFNISGHFNALGVHSNVADPQFGAFFGTYPRRYRGDFELIF